MLGYKEFHNDLTAKYCKLFGRLFADLEVYRDNRNGKPSLQKVPLTFASKDKVLEFARKNFFNEESAVATISPRMSYDLVAIQMDTSRKQNKFNTIHLSNGSVRSGIPYNFVYELNIVGKTETDCQRIVEQIIPFFDPSITVTIHPFSGDTTYSYDVIIQMGQVSKTDTYQGEAEDRRVVTWTLEFVLKGMLFGPVKDHGKPIKKVILSFNDSESTETFPGLTSSGEPTFDPVAAIDYKLVNSDDNFAIITVYE
jgi:hypothetical protein